MGIDVSGWVDVNRSRWKLVLYFWNNGCVTKYSRIALDKKNPDLSHKHLFAYYVTNNRLPKIKDNIKIALMYDNFSGAEMYRQYFIKQVKSNHYE